MTNRDLGDAYFLKNDHKLTPQENKALKISEKYQTGKNSSLPTLSQDGSIQYIYGVGQFQVLCAPFQACDVALQEGEVFNNLLIGDKRFAVHPGITGVGDKERLHLLITTTEVGLDTTLVITTDRRVYHFRLRSVRDKFMPYVTFLYPDEVNEEWQKIKQIQKAHVLHNPNGQNNEYLGNLNFNYVVFGTAPWKPCRIYNDGVKTIIEFPKKISQTDAPTFLVLRSRGFLKPSETVLVNYRIQNNRYIIDAIFDKGILISGVGASQKKITIRRKA